MDLDNTLVDRDRGFRAWAQHFTDEISADPADLDWLTGVLATLVTLAPQASSSW